jgi:CPA1 family monovalent cation:H+ antiporter
VEVPWSDPFILASIAATILIVAFARTVSIYPVVGVFNFFSTPQSRVPRSWQHLLSWGSLRGALAVTMVLLIPETLTIPNWTLESATPREFILALTVGCIFATLFIKATTMQNFMRKLKLDELTDIEKVEHVEATALIHHEVAERLAQYASRGYINKDIASKLLTDHSTEYEKAAQTVSLLSSAEKNDLAFRVLRMYAIGIERKHLKELYHYNEVNEEVYRRISGKLTLQFEAIERGELEPNMSLHTDSKDVFEKVAAWIKRTFSPLSKEELLRNEYMYYRAQTIISRKVLKTLTVIDSESAHTIFTKDAFTHVVELYEKFRRQSEDKMNSTYASNPTICNDVAYQLALSGVNKIEETLLEEISEQGFITPKLSLALHEEFRK